MDTKRDAAVSEIKLDVTLNTTTTPPHLDVDQQNNSNHVPRNPTVQKIRWKLTSDASKGTFNSLTDPNYPAFKWLSTPPPPSGIFSNLELSNNDKEMTMEDLNVSAGTTGEWIYQLSATIDNVVYQSGAISISGATTNPTIKNE